MCAVPYGILRVQLLMIFCVWSSLWYFVCTVPYGIIIISIIIAHLLWRLVTLMCSHKLFSCVCFHFHSTCVDAGLCALVTPDFLFHCSGFSPVSYCARNLQVMLNEWHSLACNCCAIEVFGTRIEWQVWSFRGPGLELLDLNFFHVLLKERMFLGVSFRYREIHIASCLCIN